MRARHFLPFLLAVLVVAGCTATPVDRDEPGDLVWPGQIISYRKAVSERHGIVGYVLEYEYAKDTWGESFRAFHVYDLDFEERGILNQTGTGVKIVTLPRETARVKGVVKEQVPLEAHPLEFNVAVILEVEDAGRVRLVKATQADLKRAQ